MNKINKQSHEPDLGLFKSFSRTIAEMEWLLLLVAVLYLLVVKRPVTSYTGVVTGVAAFTAFFVGFHYANFFRIPARWKLAIESWAMIAFITWLLWFTGKTNSPLVDLYLIVIITSGLTLGKAATLLEVGAIASCYLLLRVSASDGASLPTAMDSISFLASMAPFLLVGYLTTMLADDIHFANQRIRDMAQTDGLTGLYNVRMFRSLGEREYAQAVRYQKPFSVLIADVDNLKALNDAHGHSLGDQLLITVAEMITVQLRESDLAARYGGDEFALLLPQTTNEGALELARRLLWSLDAISLNSDGVAIPVSISIGVASFPEHGGTLKEVIDQADQAMYRCKQNGKNSAVVAEALRERVQASAG